MMWKNAHNVIYIYIYRGREREKLRVSSSKSLCERFTNYLKFFTFSSSSKILKNVSQTKSLKNIPDNSFFWPGTKVTLSAIAYTL